MPKMPKEHSAQTSLSKLYSQHLDVLNERLGSALETAGFESMVVLAGKEQQIGRDDLSYPYSVEPYFKAWVPLTQHPGCVLKLAPSEKPLLVYLQPKNYWHEPPINPDGYWVKHFDIRIAETPRDALKMLGPSQTKHAVIGHGVNQTADFTSVNDPKLLQELDYYRAFKTTYEIKCIEYANQIAARGHIAAQNAMSLEVSEFHTHHVYCAATNQRETELPYPNVIALNEHASILHYQHLDQRCPREIHSLLIDAGAQFNGYASDITRTWSVDNPRLQKLINAVNSMQQFLCSQVKTGADFVDINDLAHRLVADILCRQKFVLCGADQAYESGITRTFLPHGLGHLLGLQVHDVGGRQTAPDGTLRPPPTEYPYLRLTRVLESGFVLTIEPGIYFIPILLQELAASANRQNINWQLIEKFIPFGGVRIEDDVVVTASKVCNLTRKFLPSLTATNAL